MSIYVDEYYTWDWKEMIVTSISNSDYVYDLKWNEELDNLECKTHNKHEVWDEVAKDRFNKAVESYKNYIAEQILLGENNERT